MQRAEKTLHSQQPAVVMEAHGLRYARLQVEEQGIVLATREQMQPVAHPMQKSHGLTQQGGVSGRETGLRHEFLDRTRLSANPRQPEYPVIITQAPQPLFQIGFKQHRPIAMGRQPAFMFGVKP